MTLINQGFNDRAGWMHTSSGVDNIDEYLETISVLCELSGFCVERRADRRCRMDQQVARVFVASGEMEAQQVRAFLEAAGLSTIERGEALRNTHGLTLDGLGAVEIFVPSENADEARELLSSVEAGRFRVNETDDAPAADQAGPPRDSKA